MLSIPSVVTGGKHEWLRAVGGPLGFVVELAGVPDDLQARQLSQHDQMVDVLRLTSSMTCGIFTG